MYAADFVEAAIPLLWDHTLTVQVAREDGMPGGTVDPRKAQDPHVRMIDVRRAWDQCEWLDLDLRRAVFAWGVAGTQEAAGELIGVNQATISRRVDRAVELMVIWLNSTFADRKQWMKDLEAIEKYGSVDGVRARQLQSE